LKAFLKNNSDNKVEIISEDYVASSSDSRSVLLKFKQRGIEALFINSGSEQSLATTLKQLRQMKFSGNLYATYFPASSTFRNLVTDHDAEGIIFTDFPALSETVNTEGAKLVEKFEAQFGKMNSWDIILVTTYEALRALDEAISSGQDVKKYLYSNEFSGIFGKYHFDQNGDIVGFRHVLKQIKDGKASRISDL